MAVQKKKTSTNKNISKKVVSGKSVALLKKNPPSPKATARLSSPSPKATAQRRKKGGFDLKKIFEVDRLVRYFIISDLFFMGGWGLVGPVFAIFIIADVEGATLITIGSAAGVYWLVRSIVQLPVALYLDKKEGERDDFHALIFSLMLSGVASFSFVLVENIFALFFVIAVKAVAFGFYTPAWSAIFSRHLDKKRYAFDWSLDNASVGIAFGLTAFLGSAIVSFLGFKTVFIIAGLLSFSAVMVLLSVPNLILPKVTNTNSKVLVRDHTPRNLGR